MSTENYHRAYCKLCNDYVNPQVVASTHVYGGGGGVGSSVTYAKMCPVHGEEVFSQSDVDAYKRKQSQEESTRKAALITVLAIVGAGFGFVVLVVAVFFYLLWPSR
ncbi:MAG TPA: hypothetical protein VJS64_11460 [Pyrinomonadaceae bacterium]|nr:hypothetical protein [Pyrinomonadaceae bacterium]